MAKKTQTNAAKQYADLLSTQSSQVQKLHDIVTKAIEEEKLLTTNLQYPSKEKLTPGQKVADTVARFGGSWSFIITFLVILFVWIAFNAIAGKESFDPYPFILMNLVLSCVAALQAPIIMMSQNRTEEKDRQRAENDYMVNLKAELEIRNLHAKIDLLLEEQMQTLYEFQTTQLKELEHIKKELAELKKR